MNFYHVILFLPISIVIFSGVLISQANASNLINTDNNQTIPIKNLLSKNEQFQKTSKVDSEQKNIQFLLKSIAVGDGPYDVAYNDYNQKLYVTNSKSNSISVIDPSSGAGGSVITTITSGVPPGKGPTGIIFNPSNHNMYVANYGGNTVSVINSTTNTIKQYIQVESRPLDLVYNDENGLIYVSNSGSDSISIINPETSKVQGKLSISKPSNMAYNPFNDHIYVASWDPPIINNSIYSLALDNRIDSIIPVDGDTKYNVSLEYNPFDNNIYAATNDPDTISIIDLSSNIFQTAIPLGSEANSVVLNPNDGTILASIYRLDTISIISPFTEDTINDISPVGGSPAGITYNPSNDNFYVANYDSDTVGVIDVSP